MLSRLRSALGLRRRLPVYFDPGYRLPIIAPPAVDLRRALRVRAFLEEVVPADCVQRPARLAWSELRRVHDPRYLAELHETATLERIFAATVPSVDGLLAALRRAAGGTLAAAQAVLASGGQALNLLGGFHHAFPDHGGGGCALNDVAAAIASLRAGGFTGQVAILDLDAHPPDGTAACVAGDPRVWLGSISGVSWGPLPAACDETVLPAGSGDASYLGALEALLSRMPRAALTFVLAGGDVLKGDALGQLALSLGGARRRDARVRRAVGPAVWLPAGGYSADAWKVLAGTALVLAGRSEHEAIPELDPLAAADDLEPSRLTDEDPLAPLLLDYYSAAGIEYALSELGLVEHVMRLGYHDLEFEIARAEVGGERLRVTGMAAGERHLLVECVLEKQGRLLYVHWLSMRDPRARFARPSLPGQDAPGLGLSREVTGLFVRMALRLELAGVAFAPAWLHAAAVARKDYRFEDPARQGRFEALLRDLAHLPLAEASRAVAEGRVKLDGQPYAWEADMMVHWLEEHPEDEAAVQAAREAAHFTCEAPASAP